MNPEDARLDADKRFRSCKAAAIFSGRVADQGSAIARSCRICDAPRRSCGSRFGVGASLNNTSPPPLTWMSIKPGASQAFSGRSRTGIALGSSPRGTIAAMSSALDQDGAIVAHDMPVENVAGGDGADASAHRVRVTFCKCRGRSTSVPRSAASADQKRIETLNQTDRIGVGLIGQQVPAAGPALARPESATEHASAFAAQISGEIGKAHGRDRRSG